MSVADDVGLDRALEKRRIAEMRRRLCEHRARLNRLIVQGLPTQVMEDCLRKMEAGLRASQERHCLPGAHRETLLEPELPRAASSEPAGLKRDAPPPSRSSQCAA
jgi:hypothetical protein